MKKIIMFAVALMICFSLVLFSDNEERYPYSDYAEAKHSPSDRIGDSELKMFSDRAVIEKEDLIWAKIRDTHSMEPVLNSGSISLELPPNVASDIKVGDIISFRHDNKIIIHRVADTGEDPDGWFAVTKGDNNNRPDPYKVRFENVKGVVVGILY